MTAIPAPVPVGPPPRELPLRGAYRLQLHPGFTLSDAAQLTDYLRDLGISHIYLSPVLRSRHGSTHGYDVVDPASVDPELGGEIGLTILHEALAEYGLGLLLDIVPNHMATDVPANRWWTDILRHGPRSAFASFFDIDWDPPETRHRGTILLPVLADHAGRVLEAGQLQLCHIDGELWFLTGETTFPVDPLSLRTLAGDGVAHLGALAEAFAMDAITADRDTAASPTNQPTPAEDIDAAISAINADVDVLDTILRAQNYRLMFWRTGRDDLDYRRFFDVDELVGLRVERTDVFEAIHARLFDWAARGLVDGVRVDHIDGLSDPTGYVDRLRAALPHQWLLVEKILEGDEELRADWPVDGTTGYEFAADVGGLFVDPAGAATLTALWTRYAPDDRPQDTFVDTVRAAKLDVLHTVLRPEVDRLVASLLEVCARHRRCRDFSRLALTHVVRELLVALEVYRTYVTTAPADDDDRAQIEQTIERVRAQRPDIDAELLDLVRDVWLAEPWCEDDAASELRRRLQQISPPVMAKSVEDTAFYRDARLLALNEVGADPATFGTTVNRFHERNRRRQQSWPRGLLTLSTHDTKRSEDVRARLAVLSELPDEWATTVEEWFEHNRAVHPDPVHPADEYVIYQTLVGAFPIDVARLQTVMHKALREAKLRSTWLEPDERYEEAVDAFIAAILGDADFVRRVEAFVTRLLEPGRRNALAQKLLQLTAPGVPDLYQGQELWDLSLVDPDNRRPVDYEQRRALLTRVTDGAIVTARLRDPSDPGVAKLAVVHHALDVRRRLPEHFDAKAAYEPLWATGPQADHVVAYLRGTRVAVVVPRLWGQEDLLWDGTVIDLPPGRWAAAFAPGVHHEGRVELAHLFAPFPVALLVRTDE